MQHVPAPLKHPQKSLPAKAVKTLLKKSRQKRHRQHRAKRPPNPKLRTLPVKVVTTPTKRRQRNNPRWVVLIHFRPANVVLTGKTDRTKNP